MGIVDLGSPSYLGVTARADSLSSVHLLVLKSEKKKCFLGILVMCWEELTQWNLRGQPKVQEQVEGRRMYVLSKYLKKKLGRLRLQEEKGVM